MKSQDGSIRYHRGGYEIRFQHEGKRHTTRLPGEESMENYVAAQERLRELVRTVKGGTHDMTVADALRRYEQARSSEWSPSTRASHPHHVAPYLDSIGGIRLSDLLADEISDLYEEWREEGKAPGTIRRRHSVLSAALGHAVKRRWILYSPACDVCLPRVVPVLDNLPDHQVVSDAIARIDLDRLREIANLALNTGARRGELLALRWSDLSLERKELRIRSSIAKQGNELIRKETKGRLARTIAIDDASVTDLRRLRVLCGERCLATGIPFGDALPVFGAPTDFTQPTDPNRVTQDWGRWRVKVGLDGFTFHQLRHRHATTLLSDLGRPPHEVSARLGHSSVRTTLDIYAHALPAGDRAAADAIGALRRSG